MKPMVLLSFALLVVCLCTACASAAPTGDLTVFAATSLAEAFEEAAKVFEAQHSGSRLLFNFAGSQQLAQQLAQGASADVFASADRKQMDAAVQSGRVEAHAPQIFARNQLVIVYPGDNPGQIRAIQDLAKPGLRLVMADKAVPVGAYTFQFLEKAASVAELGEGFGSGYLANVVSYEENVRSVLSKVLLGEADAGIVYTSDLAGVKPGEAGFLAIPGDLNVVADYYAAPISDSRNMQMAKSWLNFLRSIEGQAILARHGFLRVE